MRGAWQVGGCPSARDHPDARGLLLAPKAGGRQGISQTGSGQRGSGAGRYVLLGAIVVEM